MLNDTVAWLLDTGNPAVRYRTKTELLGLEAKPTEALMWIEKKLPEDWYKIKGLWYVYYINALAECGLNQSMLPSEWFEAAINRIKTSFDFGCEAFMLLQAMVTLGFGENPDVQKIFALLCDNRLPDGGFLCEKRKNRLKYIPKSCYKADYYALRLCSCCRKNGIVLDIEQDIIQYFLDRNLLFKRNNLNELVLNEKEGQRNADVFHPFEVMRIGIHNIMETISSLGYGNVSETASGWNYLNSANQSGKPRNHSPTIHAPQCRKRKRGRYRMTRATELENRGNVFTLFTGCAQIYHQRWYVRSPRGKFHLHGLLRRALSDLRQPKGETTIPLRKLRLLPLNEAMLHFVNICVQTKVKVWLLSAHKVYPCAPLRYQQNVGVAYG